MVLDTGDAMNSYIETCLANLLERNEERYKHCLVICDIPITDTIKTYKLDLPDNVTTKSEKAQLQATYLKSEEKFAKAANFLYPIAKNKLRDYFATG